MLVCTGAILASAFINQGGDIELALKKSLSLVEQLKSCDQNWTNVQNSCWPSV